MIDRRTMIASLGAGGTALLLFGISGKASAKFAVSRTPAEWRRILGPERFAVLREAGTERPFSSALDKERRRGTFLCAGCALPLFSSATKFDSRTGWPSFWKALPNAVVTRGDRNLFFGTEILCSRCGGHLGHVFNDGPKPTGLRYCVNGLALRFRAA